MKGLALIFSLILITSCSLNNGKTNPNAINGASLNSLSSIEAFERTVYPVTRANCVNCHNNSIAPFHASDSIATAHDSLRNGGKVNFNNADDSRIVAKVRDGHNCWSTCEDSAEQLKVAVNNWAALMINEGNSSYPFMTKEFENLNQFITANAKAKNLEQANEIILNIEAASLNPPMQIAYNGIQAYGFVDEDQVGPRQLGSNAPEAGALIFEFNVPQGGEFDVHFLVQTYNTRASYQAYFNLDGLGFTTFTINDTNEIVEWRNPSNLRDISLSAGKHFLTIKERHPGLAIYGIVFTKNKNFQAMNLDFTKLATLSHNFKDQLGEDVIFSIDIGIVNDEYYLLTQPQITSTRKTKVESINILYNGQNQNSWSTFRAVNKTVLPQSPIISFQTLLLPRESLKDKIQFGINHLSFNDSYIPETDPSTLTNFEIFKIAMNNYCFNCHKPSTNNVDFTQFVTENDWRTSNLVIPGDALNSPIYYRLRNSEGGMNPDGEPKDMPRSNPALATYQLQAIKAWIDNL